MLILSPATQAKKNKQSYAARRHDGEVLKPVAREIIACKNRVFSGSWKQGPVYGLYAND